MPTLVSTGQITISDVTDGLNARLSSESHIVPAETDGSSGDFTGCSTTMSVFLGTLDDSSNWTYSASPTAGVVGSLVGSTYTVTDMTTDAGYVDITASRVGYASLTSRFSITKAKRGNAGPAITIVSSAQGFTFRDNVAYPADQVMSFTVVRQNAAGPVEFYASGGATLTTDNGQLLLSNYTAGVPGCGEGETCYLDLAGFGDNQQVTITAVVGNLTATKTIIRLDSSTAEAGATVGAIWGQNVVNQPSFTDFLESFESGNVDLWQNYEGSGELSVVAITDAQTGGKALRIGNNSGNDQAWLIHKHNIPFDPNATYRVKFRVRQLAGSGAVYIGLAGIAADGSTLVNFAGANSYGSQYYVAGSGVTPTAQWTEYVGFVKGVAATGDSSTKPSILSPGKMHQNVRYIRPLVLANYSNKAGIVEVDYCRIELLTDSVNWDGVTGAGKDTLIQTANDASTAAATANNLLADMASDSKLTAVEKQQTKAEWDGIVAEKAGINAQAAAFSITTENTAYNNAYITLESYLAPLLANLTSTSDITGTIFRSNFANLYAARQALLNKIAEEAGKRSVWTSVTGKPSDEQILNVLVPQGVYHKTEFPYPARSQYIPCVVENDSGTAGWFKVADIKLIGAYRTANFMGAIYWGQSGRRYNYRSDVKIFMETGGGATTLGNYGFRYSGDNCAGVLKVRRYQDTDSQWRLAIFVYLNAWGGALLDGVWYASTVSTSYVDDFISALDALPGDPGYTEITPVANFELGANNTYLDSNGNLQGVSSGGGQSVANNVDGIIRAPGGGSFRTSAPTMTGALKIALPVYFTSTMVQFQVDIYEYAAGYSCSLVISGYNYSGTNRWLQVTARVMGGSNVEYPVYYGHDGSKACVWIGTPTETWSYPQVTISNVSLGFGNTSRSMWESGWAISFDPTVLTSGYGANQYGAAVLDTLPGANWSKISGANKPADNASVNAPSLGIKPNYISFTSANPGECWLHGFGKDGNPVDAAGWVSVNGQKVTVPYGKPIYTQMPSTSGYIMLDTAGETFVTSEGSVPFAFVRFQNGQWAYDNNTGWVNFTPAATHYLIGNLQTGGTPDSVVSASVWGYGLLPSTVAEAGATRNVHRGPWANTTAYAIGDTVIHGGYGWSCVLAHTSATDTNTPPTYPTTSNTWWTLAAVKGDDAKMAMLTASSFVFKVAADGTVSPSSIALAAVGQNLAGSPTFTVTSGTATLTGTGEARVLTAANLTTDQATIKITWDGREDFVTITKVREGASGLSIIMSNEAHALPAASNGTVSSYAGSGTTVQVYEGGTALSASSSATVSAFRIGTITQTPASTITVGAVTYAGTTATIANHSAMVADTDTVTLVIPVTIYRADGSSVTINKVQTITKAKQGVDGYQGADGQNAFVAILSNEAHVFPAASDGTISSYASSGTEIRVYEGATELTYDGVGTANGTWKVSTSGTNITIGSLTDSGTYLTVGQHSGVAAETDVSSIVYTITGKSASGAAFSITKQQTFSKSKAGSAGAPGAPGAQGPAVRVTSDRSTTFTATDGALDGSQADIVFTASVSGISSPTYVWSFSGFQTAPTNSGTATQTITAAQFGTAKAATVTCTVNGVYVDKLTIVRLEKSTAEAGATVGATIGTNVDGQITSGNVSTFIADAAIGSAQIGSLALVGNFSVKSGLTGQRVEMDANGGRVYDSNNVLRVRWGVW